MDYHISIFCIYGFYKLTAGHIHIYIANKLIIKVLNKSRTKFKLTYC